MNARANQLFKKRKARIRDELERREATRNEYSRILVVSEGTKTEPKYLERLRIHFGLPPHLVIICGESGPSPTTVVEFGIDKFSADSDFDSVFFVFDRDGHVDYAPALQRLRDFAATEQMADVEVHAITSFPCFEFWLLCHLERHTRPYAAAGDKSSCDRLLEYLTSKPEFASYSKSDCKWFDDLVGLIDIAKANSRSVLEEHRKHGEQEHFGNPSTYMHLVILAFEKLANEFK